MKVCVLGNSHVAKYTNASVDLAKSYPDLSIDYFGVSYPRVLGMLCDERGHYRVDASLAKASGQRPARILRSIRMVNDREYVDLNEYDAVFFVGNYIKLKDIFRIFAEYDIDRYPGRQKAHLMSLAAFDEIVDEIVQSHIPTWIKHMSNATNVYASIMPFLSEDCTKSTNPEYDYLRSATSRTVGLPSLMERVHKKIETKLSNCGAKYIRQRKETISKEILTKSRFSIGSRVFGLDADAHPKDDFIHMNAEYAKTSFKDFNDVAFPG